MKQVHESKVNWDGYIVHVQPNILFLNYVPNADSLEWKRWVYCLILKASLSMTAGNHTGSTMLNMQYVILIFSES